MQSVSIIVYLKVITYGATITSMKVPNKYGVSQDVILGFDDLNGIFLLNIFILRFLK